MDLKYVGKGAFTHGIPDTDLTKEDIERLAADRGVSPAQLRKDLIASGLYAGKEAKA